MTDAHGRVFWTRGPICQGKGHGGVAKGGPAGPVAPGGVAKGGPATAEAAPDTAAPAPAPTPGVVEAVPVTPQDNTAPPAQVQPLPAAPPTVVPGRG